MASIISLWFRLGFLSHIIDQVGRLCDEQTDGLTDKDVYRAFVIIYYFPGFRLMPLFTVKIFGTEWTEWPFLSLHQALSLAKQFVHFLIDIKV